MKRWFLLTLVALAAALASGPAAAGDIVVGCAKDIAPMDEVRDGTCAGFDPDLWEAVAGRLGLEYTLKPMAFQEIIPALMNNELDAAMGAISITAKRERMVDFSHPYFESGLLIAVRTQNEDIETINDLRGTVTATVRDSTSAKLLESLQQVHRGGNSKSFGPGTLRLYPEIRHALEAVRYGRADAVLFDAPMVLHYIRTEGDGTLKVVGPLYRSQFYGFAFPPDSELRELVSIAIMELQEGGKYNKIFCKWFGDMMLRRR
jgi:glutamine transport system substrate-binding protein